MGVEASSSKKVKIKRVYNVYFLYKYVYIADIKYEVLNEYEA